jgi:hypothetical protein
MAGAERFQNSYGQKIPLYSPEEIKKLAKYKRHRTKIDEPAFQPSLWPDKLVPNEESYESENVIDPEKKIFQLGYALDSRFYRHKKTFITEEIGQKNWN